MVLVAVGGGGDDIPLTGAETAWFTVQVTSLEAYQTQLSTMLQDTEAQLTKVNTTDGSSSFGGFSEATTLYNSYESTKAETIAQFQEVSQLIDAMVTALGKNASNYSEAEAQIQTQFNSILTQYGDTPLPTPTSSSTQVDTPDSTSSGTSTSTSSSSATNTLMGNM